MGWGARTWVTVREWFGEWGGGNGGDVGMEGGGGEKSVWLN